MSLVKNEVEFSGRRCLLLLQVYGSYSKMFWEITLLNKIMGVFFCLFQVPFCSFKNIKLNKAEKQLNNLLLLIITK